MWSKSIFTSKTFIVNAIAFLVSLITMIADQSWMPPQAVTLIVTMAIPILNIILRWITVQPAHIMTPYEAEMTSKNSDVEIRKAEPIKPTGYRD